MTESLKYASIGSSRWKHLPPPPGFSSFAANAKKSEQSSSTATSSSYAALKASRAWELAISPAKSLPMQAFMLYMSGGGVQVFSMGIVFVLLLTPFKNIAAMNQAFAQFAPTPASARSFKTLTLQKLVYLACNLLTLAVGLWKCQTMGLLPIGTGDWLAFETRGQPPELSLF